LRWFWPFVAALLLVTGCALVRPPQPLPDVSIEELQGHLLDLSQRFRSLKGLARVAVATGERNLSGSQVLLAEKPDRIRSEALALFGQPWLILAADGKTLQVFVPGEGRFYSGAASPENLQRFTRLPLRIEDLVHLLLYQVPLLPGEVRLQATESGPQLLLTDAQGDRQLLDFDRDLQLVASRYFDPQGGLWLEVAYRGFLADQQGFPGELELRMPGYELTAKVSFREVELNAAIPAEKFSLQPPAGIDITPLALTEDKP